MWRDGLCEHASRILGRLRCTLRERQREGVGVFFMRVTQRRTSRATERLVVPHAWFWTWAGDSGWCMRKKRLTCLAYFTWLSWWKKTPNRYTNVINGQIYTQYMLHLLNYKKMNKRHVTKHNGQYEILTTGNTRLLQKQGYICISKMQHNGLRSDGKKHSHCLYMLWAIISGW